MPKVSMDKKYKTQSGADVELVGIDFYGTYSVVGRYFREGKKRIGLWTSEGKFSTCETDSSLDLVEVAVIPPIPKGYTAWYGGEVSPVPLTHAFYFIRRDGQIFLGRPGGFYRWTHEDLDNDIIGYIVVEPEKEESDELKLEEKIEKVIDRILNVMDERCGNLRGSELNEMAKAVQTLKYLITIPDYVE
jgi:hypothetical protein